MKKNSKINKLRGKWGIKQALFFAGILFISGLAQADSSLKLRFPIANSDRALISSLPVIGMDHDHSHHGEKIDCKNYRGATAPFCYNGHEGTDFSLIGGFPVMDNGSADVVAAAAGTVTKVVDGNFDRCMYDIKEGKVSCFGHKMQSNYVEIKHKNGMKTRYLHLKKNSIKVRVGDRVRCGEFLGLVGSSGHSSLPHLHFELIDTNRKRIDPYGGKLSQPFDYWLQAFAEDGLPSGNCYGRPKNPGPKCTWETIQDAGLCGVETVTNAYACGSEIVACGTEIVACGTELVTDAAQCGVDTVTSAAQCGVETITSATQCGVDTVTSAAQCGVNTIESLWECAQKGLAVFNGACEEPKTCTVPKSCSQPLTCDVPKTCEVDLQCEVDKMCEMPNTCQLPKSCQVKKCKGNKIRKPIRRGRG